MRRREALIILGAALLRRSPAAAQQPRRRWRLGLLANRPLPPIERLKSKLRELGYFEGDNLIIDARFTDGRDDQYPMLAAELVSAGVDLIIVWGTPAALAAKHATSSVPVVVAAVGDVISTGIVTNLSHPGGNITGFSAVNADIEEKRLAILVECVPHLKRLGVLANSQNALNKVNLETIRRAAERSGVSVHVAEIRESSEVVAALRGVATARPDAVLLGSDTVLLGEREKIVAFLAEARIPAIYPFRDYADAGGLMFYGADISALFEQSASYIDRILKGTHPGNLPVQQASAFNLIINIKAANALRLAIPPTLLARADEVIE